VQALGGGVQHPVSLQPDAVVSREDLFEAFRGLFDGRAREHFTKLDGSWVDVQVLTGPDGVVAVLVGKTRWLFGHADLLARNHDTRMAAFDRVASYRTITLAEEEIWRDRLQSAPLDNESFIG
jgi:hypothetical protein